MYSSGRGRLELARCRRRSPRRDASGGGPVEGEDLRRARRVVHAGELGVGADRDLAVELVVGHAPAHQRLAVLAQHHLAGAVVVGDRVPARHRGELEEVRAHRLAVGPRRLAGPGRRAEAERRDVEAGVPEAVLEVERHHRDQLAVPGFDRLVVDAGDHVARVDAEVLADRRAADLASAAAGPGTRCRRRRRRRSGPRP